jgi:hypothetical protein
MLSLPNDGRYPVLDLDPQHSRQKTLGALTAQMEALSRQNPVLMIFEDAPSLMRRAPFKARLRRRRHHPVHQKRPVRLCRRVGEHLTSDRKIAAEGVVIAGRWWYPR